MNKFKKKYLTVAMLASVAVTAALSTTAMAGTAKGKPFVALEGQIVEVQGAVLTLQDQVNDLIGQVDSLEGRVTASELAVANLQDQNSALGILIAGAYTGVDDVYAEIDLLAADVTADNEALIATLQAAIATIEEGQFDLESNLQEQIDNNTALIDVLQSQLDAMAQDISLKQDLLSGKCPGGEFVVEVGVDGSLLCEASQQSGGGSAILIKRTKYTGADIEAGHVNYKIDASCPTGYFATGGGHLSNSFDTVVRSSRHTFGADGEGWQLNVINKGSYKTYVWSVAQCLKLYNP